VKSSSHSLLLIDKDGLTRFAQDLVRCQSWNPPGDEAGVAAIVAAQLTAFGVQTEVVPITPTRHNVVARIPGTGSGPGTLLLAGHMDTVPPGEGHWERAPLSGDLANGRIYGRGSSDMKGGLAAIVFAVGAVAQSGFRPSSDIVLAATVGEEVDCLGAARLVQDGLAGGVSAVGIPEPTGLDLVIAHKGALWVRIRTLGRAAHGARPDLGVNAILHMQETIRQVTTADWSAPAHPLLGQPSQNIATIHGGTKTNMVPDRCELTIDFRSLPGQEHSRMMDQLQNLLDDLAERVPGYSAQLETINDKAAVSTRADSPLVLLAQQVGEMVLERHLDPRGVSYYTDASVLGPASGAPVIILGPGEADLAHQTNEWLSVDKLHRAARVYARLATDWLS